VTIRAAQGTPERPEAREGGFRAAHPTETNSLFNYTTLFAVSNNDLSLVAGNKTVRIVGVRGVDCEPGQQAHCDKRNSDDIAQFGHLPSPLGFQGRLIRQAPLTSGDPFMSRKTVEKWAKAFR
jgi:hypothetical protein